MNKHGKTIYLFILFAVAITAIALFFIDRKYKVVVINTPRLNSKSSIKTPNTIPLPHPVTNTPQPEINPSAGELKSSILLAAPFTPQAPTANWDKLHNEACEEAVSIMANAYFSSSTETTLKPKYVEQEIAKLTKWQQENFGYNLDTNLSETALMLKSVYKIKTQIIENFTELDIKTALLQNKLVIISTSGRLLNNPNYKRPGPLYHMLLIKGYTETAFITNDSGTKKGLNYNYTFDTLYKASGDWNHKTKNVDTNIKNILLVSK
jgi:hypothetical protein